MIKKMSISQFFQELSHIITDIHRLSRNILAQSEDALLQGKITFPQYIVLSLLTSKNLKMKDIAMALGVSLPAVTGIINRLVKLKMVERAYDSGDRRVIFIALTPRGTKATKLIEEARRRFIEEIFGELNDVERNTYLSILRKVKKVSHEKSKNN